MPLQSSQPTRSALALPARVLLAALLLQGCTVAESVSTEPRVEDLPASVVETTAMEDSTEAAVAEAAPAEEEEEVVVAEEEELPPIEYGQFDEATLTEAILAELAIQNGNPAEALDIYTRLARENGNISFIQRGMRLAVFLRNTTASLELGQMWLELEPDTVELRQMMALQLVLASRYAEALNHMTWLLEQGEAIDFRLIPSRLAEDPAAPLILEAMIEDISALAERYPQSQSLRLSLSLLHEQNEDLEAALAVMEALNADSGDQPELVIREIQLLEALNRVDDATKRLQRSLANNANSKQLRFMYARKLVAERRYAEAREQFSIIVEQDPRDMDMLYSLALLSMEVNMLDEARGYWQRLLLGGQHRDEAHFYLGLIEEERGNRDAAIRHYLQVEGGNNYMLALRNLTGLMIEDGRYAEAHAHLQNVRFRNAEYNLPLLSMEAALLIELEHYSEAGELLDSAIAAFPNNIQLLFQRSVLYTELNLLPEMEADLRRIMLLDPQSPVAYNSLGYYLADRTDRYEEAYELILKAIELAPNDPAIIDSLGWVQYRLGMYDEAVVNLERAYELFPDPEVAAHLGEVLWMMGRRSAANRIWNEALETAPDSKFVLETMERLNPDKRR